MFAAPTIAPQPILLSTRSWPDFELLDSGHGRKLERYGPYRVVRPEPQCFWAPRLPAEIWDQADAVFDPQQDDEDTGRWRFRGAPDPLWTMSWQQVRFQGRFTPFRHLAFFPEQAANWTWLDQTITAAPKPQRILNLFGYTGVASLVCAAAGAEVTHIDASKKAIGWARENAALSGLQDHPVRWICEDARKYVAREVRRGSQYDGIILDPPKYGRGPNGDVWRLLDDLPGLLDDCAALLAPDAGFLLLNGYAERVSGLALAGAVQQALSGRDGQIDWGELGLIDAAGRGAGLSFFARWSRTA